MFYSFIKLVFSLHKDICVKVTSVDEENSKMQLLLSDDKSSIEEVQKETVQEVTPKNTPQTSEEQPDKKSEVIVFSCTKVNETFRFRLKKALKILKSTLPQSLEHGILKKLVVIFVLRLDCLEIN